MAPASCDTKPHQAPISVARTEPAVAEARLGGGVLDPAALTRGGGRLRPDGELDAHLRLADADHRGVVGRAVDDLLCRVGGVAPGLRAVEREVDGHAPLGRLLSHLHLPAAAIPATRTPLAAAWREGSEWRGGCPAFRSRSRGGANRARPPRSRGRRDEVSEWRGTRRQAGRRSLGHRQSRRFAFEQRRSPRSPSRVLPSAGRHAGRGRAAPHGGARH